MEGRAGSICVNLVVFEAGVDQKAMGITEQDGEAARRLDW